jgi:hypothetical protein
MKTKSVKTLQRRIEMIKTKLTRIGDMRPGSLSKRYNICGNPTCRCKDKDNPKKHGPYYQISYTHRGKSKTEFVRKGMEKQVKKELKNYREFRRLTQQWVDLSLETARIRRQESGSEGGNDQDKKHSGT